MGHSLHPEIERSMRANRPIEAIKLYREMIGCDVVTAKNTIESYWFQVTGDARYEKKNNALHPCPKCLSLRIVYRVETSELTCLDCGYSRSPKPAAEPRPMTQELPKQDLLVKMLAMTTSDNDGQALVAIRKANALMASAGWTWEQLITAKITVVEDPFKNVAAPTNDRRAAPQPPQPPTPPAQWPTHPHASKPSPPPRPSYTPPPQAAAPPPRARANSNYSSRPNKYPGGCYCCGDTVGAGEGYSFLPSDFNAMALKGKWAVLCDSCNKTGFVGSAAARRTNKPAAAPDLYTL